MNPTFLVGPNRAAPRKGRKRGRCRVRLAGSYPTVPMSFQFTHFSCPVQPVLATAKGQAEGSHWSQWLVNRERNRK